MNHESEVDYSKRGPGAYQALASGNVPASFRGLPVYTSYPLDVDFNGAPISLLERDRMIGEWFYIKHDETIAIFSAEHDKFMTISYADAAEADMRFEHNDDGTKKTTSYADIGNGNTALAWRSFSHAANKAHPPILIFRPFQTVSALPIFFLYVHMFTSLTHSLVNNLLYNSVDDGQLYPSEGRIGARQHIP